MKRSLLFSLSISFALMESHLALSREIIYGKARETVPVAYGVETIFRFPLEVKTITEASRFEIHPANTEEPDYSILMVKPRMSEGSSNVTFLFSDGSTLRVQLVINNKPNLKKDSIYDFKPKEDLGETNPNAKDQREPLSISELDLMRAMIQGNQVSGFDVSSHLQTVAVNTPSLNVTLIKVYRGKEKNGFIYLLKNESKTKVFEINLAALAIGQPNLAVLSQVDRTTLGGGSLDERQAYLRIVAKPGASSHKIILPFAIQTNKKQDGDSK